MATDQSTQASFNDWHRCRRYWMNHLECPFMKLPGHEEDDDDDDDENYGDPPIEVPESKRPGLPVASEPRQPVDIPVPVSKRRRRPVPVLVGKDDTLDDEKNLESGKEILQFPDLRENPFTDVPQQPVPIPGRKAAQGRLPPVRPGVPLFPPAPSPGLSPAPVPRTSPTRVPSPLRTPASILNKGAALETAYSRVLAQQYEQSGNNAIVPGPLARPASSPTRPLSQSSAQLAAFIQLRNSSLWLQGKEAGGVSPTALFPPHGQASTARSPGPSQYSAPLGRTNRYSQQNDGTRGGTRKRPIPVFPIAPGRGGRGGFTFNFASQLSGLLGGKQSIWQGF